MKIGIQTWGSEGDIRPFLALADALAARGHQVRLVYTSVQNRNYDHYFSDSRINLEQLGRFNYSDEVMLDLSRRIVEAPLVAQQAKLVMENFFDPFADAMFSAADELIRDSDLVIGHFLLTPFTSALERYNTPSVVISTIPHLPTRHAPPVGLPNWGPRSNRLMWYLGEWSIKLAMGRGINRMRTHHGLPPHPNPAELLHRGDRLICAVSPTLFPRPDDWPEWARMGGFLELPADDLDWVMPEPLSDFLNAGEPPIYLGFGSLADFDPAPQESVDRLIEAIEKAGCRAIIQARWQGLKPPTNPNIFPLEYAPHGPLLPRCAGIIHHGGAGTTQAAVRAGCPSLVVPHMMDQFFWGERLYALGVALKPLPYRKLSVAALAERLRLLTDTPALSERAAALAERLGNEKGVEHSVGIIEALAREKGLM